MITNIPPVTILPADNPQICVCYDVYQDEIIQAIQQGASTVEQISELTYACQGCGSCRPKIVELLALFHV